MKWYFVAKDVGSQKLSCYGNGEQPVTITRDKAEVVFESSPIASSDLQFNPGSVRKAGKLPHGWVVIFSNKTGELVEKSNPPALLAWMKKNPPQN